MTDNELRQAWKNRCYPKQRMIKCLAELNNCTFDDMYNRLILAGILSGDFREEKPKQKEYMVNGRMFKAWSSEETAELMRMKHKGYSYEDMAKILERTKDSVIQRVYIISHGR